MFQKAKYIWHGAQSPDTYADFISDFTYTGGTLTLRICADSNYAAYINGELAAFGQYADYPENKIADTVDISALAHPGENRLAVTVWHYGRYPGGGVFTYAPGNAGVIFELESESGIIAASGSDTLSRINPGYACGRCENVSPQIGLTFHRDMVRADDEFLLHGNRGFGESRVVCDDFRASERPIKKLILGDRIPAKLLRTGVFAYAPDSEEHRASYNMQYASIGYRPIREVTDKAREYYFDGAAPITVKTDGGIFILVDLLSESVGFLDFDIEVDSDCRVDIGWGEHLYDGICRTYKRNFAVTADLRAGRNSYMNPFRRLGCRYLQFFIHADRAVVHYAGLRPTNYPVSVKPYDFGDLLRNTIYKVSLDTLHLCMHEHFEDCPWREQALYALDSRNHMLCGYFGFGEFDMARASLHLMGESVGADGLLSICAPMEGTLNIPSFTLAYFISMNEYIRYSGDTTLAAELFDTLERVMNTFTSRIDDCGLIPSFNTKGVNWNFYEWAPTLSGNIREPFGGHEAMLNLMLALALENYVCLCRALGKNDRADELDGIRCRLTAAIAHYFWDSDAKLVHTSDEYMDSYSVLVNSLALLTGTLDGYDLTNVLRILEVNGKSPDGKPLPGIIPNTLSMNCYRFDALLRHDREKYKDTVLSELDRTYFKMLREGATSFWETELGEYDFDEAGSLCHGWAALPLYYYSILL